MFEDVGSVVEGEEEEVVEESDDKFDNPWAARTFITVSQPFSNDFMRSLSSAFSRSRSLSCSDAVSLLR